MKNGVTTCASLLLCYCALSQSSNQSVINSAGGSSKYKYYQFEWSVGEMALINQMTDVGNKMIVTNGFIQPYILYPGKHHDNNKHFDKDEIRLFPNPATNYVEINFFTKQKGRLAIHLYDAMGNKSYSKEMTCDGVDLIERIPVT